MWRYAARLGAVLTCVAGMAVAVASPAAAAPGFTARFTELPDTFTAGAAPVTVAVVINKTGDGDCLKVRWSMVLRVQGLRLDQMRVDRIEEDGSFPVDTRAEGDVARLTDVQLDPGTLCGDRTVTARYAVSFAEAVARGRVTFAAEAYDARLQLLARETVSRGVVGDPVPAQPEPSGSESLDPSPGGSAPADPSALPGNPGGGAGTGRALDPAADNRGTGLPLIGFLVGAVLVFFGAGLLIRTAMRIKRAPAPEPVPAWSRATARRRRTLRF